MTDTQRIHEANIVLSTPSFRTSWRQVLVSRGCGEQNILRAELEAICFIVCTFSSGTIHMY